MLNIVNSTWRWDSTAVRDSKGLLHYTRARQTLAQGAHRMFHVGDAVILRKGSRDSTQTPYIHVAIILDFYESKNNGSRRGYRSMVFTVRWLHWNREVSDAVRESRDRADWSVCALELDDFFLSDTIEKQPNSVMTIVGRALLSPSSSELDALRTRLDAGIVAAQIVLWSGAAEELEFSENDRIILVRWFLAGAVLPLPIPFKLHAMPLGSLQALLERPSNKEIHGELQRLCALLPFRKRSMSLLPERES